MKTNIETSICFVKYFMEKYIGTFLFFYPILGILKSESICFTSLSNFESNLSILLCRSVSFISDLDSESFILCSKSF